MKNSGNDHLYAAIKQNDEEALKSFYIANYPAIEKYILQNNGSREDAKDIYQEAFTDVWRNIHAGKFLPQNEKSPAGYLYRVARNKWIDHLRTAFFKKTTPLDHMSAPFAEERQIQQDETNNDEVKEKFSQLGEPCKELLHRYYFKKESLRSIAEKFNWTEATAKNNKYRCMQRLRDSLNILIHD